jgi:hypothetical protein
LKSIKKNGIILTPSFRKGGLGRIFPGFKIPLRKPYPLIFLSPPGESGVVSPSNGIELRGSFDELRMTYLFAMVSVIVSSTNDEPSPSP